MSIYDTEQVHDWAWSIAKSTSSSESESECSKIKKNGCNKLSHMLEFTLAEYLYIKELGSASSGDLGPQAKHWNIDYNRNMCCTQSLNQ